VQVVLAVLYKACCNANFMAHASSEGKTALSGEKGPIARPPLEELLSVAEQQAAGRGLSEVPSNSLCGVCTRGGVPRQASKNRHWLHAFTSCFKQLSSLTHPPCVSCVVC
jgi:hypothetical protein